jgi:alcohol dehydrogenase (cytochrome c)
MRILYLLLVSACAAMPQLRDSRFDDPANWLTFDGDNTGQRYSRLRQIHRGNIKQLKAEWVFQTIRIPLRSEATPLVRDGVMYFTAGGAAAHALDARTGRELWNFHLQKEGEAGADWNRGAALAGNRVLMATVDCRLVALDSRNGSVVWTSHVRAPDPCFGTTAAPLVWNNLAYIGQRGGDTGRMRGHLDAFDVETGNRKWRIFTVPGPGDKGSHTWPPTDVYKLGGAATWTAGTYDPELGLLYWPTGNPGPKDYDGSGREGDNLFSDSVLALRPASGEMAWHYQFTPHDLWDWDANETPVLVDAEWRGRQRKLLLHADRNAHFYVLDRASGEFLMAAPFARQTWARSFTASGRPILNPGVTPSHRGARVCPDVHGGTNWQPPSYNPDTKLFYLLARDSCGIYYPNGPVYAPEAQKPTQVLRALDIQTGKAKWEIPLDGSGEISHAGTMTTAGGLVFFSSREGQFIAADAATGEVLWHFNTGGTIRAAPMTYMARGRQYIAIVTKAAVFAFALP